MDDMEIFFKLAQCEDKEQMQRCINEYNLNQKPMTNADRIRAMSDEELARKFVNTACYYDWKHDEDYYYFPNGTIKTNYKPKAIEAWLEWLKQQVQE